MSLEVIIGLAAVSRGWVGYLNLLFSGFGVTLPIWLYELGKLKMNILASSIVILISIVICFGIKNSAIINNIILGLTLIVIIFVIGGGFYFADIDNW
jgi:basic amino acid/polyamine antiporter, APA family